MKSHKVIAKEFHISLATAYRRFPIPKREVTQADVMILQMNGYSIRQIEELLGVPRSTVWRLGQ